MTTLHHRDVANRRATITALPLYYSSHLLKKRKKDRDFKKYHAELRGNKLFLYQDESQQTYSEMLDLEGLKSMELDFPNQKKVMPVYTLKLSTEVVQLKMDNIDTGEDWRCFILTVVTKEIPSNLKRLPGQILQLQDVLTKERTRNFIFQNPPLPPRPSSLPMISPLTLPPEGDPDFPVCYLDVSRLEAEELLEANPEYGSIIIRPSSQANSYAVTVRRPMASGAMMKHYRVTATTSGFVIELDTAVTVSSLNEVLEYFLQVTEYRLCPFLSSQPYDTHIGLSSTPISSRVTTPQLKTVPHTQVAPILQSNTPDILFSETDAEYVLPEEKYQNNNDQVPLDEELREVLKLRRDVVENSEEEDEVQWKKCLVRNSRSP